MGQSRSRSADFVAVPDLDVLAVPLAGSPVAEAAGALGEDPSVLDDPASFDDPLSEPDEPLSVEDPSSPLDAAPVLTGVRRSFFAQPEPL
jgi:hypothetical protein